MSGSDLFRGNTLPPCRESTNGEGSIRRRSARQSLKSKFEKECSFSTENASKDCSSQLSRSGGSWCDALSLSIPNVSAKQAWKNSTDKISQTLTNVRTTFGVLSQRIKKSTKRRQPLINIDSPKTPVTPYTRSKAVLGRTPTKLYSPFSIDTPTGKENGVSRTCATNKSSLRSRGKIFSKTKGDSNSMKTNNSFSCSPNSKFSNDSLQTQIGIYEFQSVANRIVQNGLKF